MYRNKKILVFIFSLFLLISLSSAFNFEGNGVKIIEPLESNGAIPVNIQDQSTRPFDIRVNKILNTNISLAVAPTINNYVVLLNSGHGVVVGDNIAFLEQNGMAQLLFGKVLNVAVNVITLDTPIPYNFTASGTSVFTFDNSLAIDGSGVPEVFTITNFFDDEIDIVRFIFHCTDTTSMDDGKFCGGTSLTRGMVLRKKLVNGNYINYWNIKNNGEWGELAFDKSYDDKAPAGLYGFSSRLTYGGQSKHGVVIRLNPGESIELIVQDNLLGLSDASLMVEGHFVQN